MDSRGARTGLELLRRVVDLYRRVPVVLQPIGLTWRCGWNWGGGTLGTWRLPGLAARPPGWSRPPWSLPGWISTEYNKRRSRLPRFRCRGSLVYGSMDLDPHVGTFPAERRGSKTTPDTTPSRQSPSASQISATLKLRRKSPRAGKSQPGLDEHGNSSERDTAPQHSSEGRSDASV